MDQDRPPSVDTKNWARAIRAPCCEPTATISAPSLVTWPSAWLMPRPLSAVPKSAPARVAGGNPRAAGGGAGPGGLLPFAPAMTTTATPNTIMATIGMITRVPTPRKWSAERNSANQLRRTGSGRNDRSSPAHSARARGLAGAWASNSKPGAARSSRDQARSSRDQACSSQDRTGGTGAGWLTVGV